MQTKNGITPLLVVRGASQAIDFYEKALGAVVRSRFEHGNERRISHADLALGWGSATTDDADVESFSLTEEARAWNSDAPVSLGGSPVVLQLSVADVDAALRSMCDEGASIVFPAQELFGERMARVRDPFGHIWILRQQLHALSQAEIQHERDELYARFATTPARDDGPAKDTHSLLGPPGVEQGEKTSTQSPRVHLVVGPVGAGKSTLALRLAREHSALRLTLDRWMSVLFRPDRPDSGLVEWYGERAERCVEQIWQTAQDALELGVDVILEIGLLRRNERQRFYDKLHARAASLVLYVVDAPREIRRARVERRNSEQGATFSQVVPPNIFELASDLWEPPDAEECAELDVRFVETGAG
jgi:predicted kinase/uncharacterized glyoxalase superfamily protein PhnB